MPMSRDRPYPVAMDAEPLTGEVVGRSRAERFRDAEARIRRVTYLLDDVVRVPGTDQRIGLDPVVGLIPVIGDVIGALVGSWVILEAARFGIPRVALARMVINLLVDLGVGIIPILGIVLDVVSRSNARNLELFRRHALDPDATTAGHWAFLTGLLLVIIGGIWLVVWVMLQIFGAIIAAIVEALF
jgi:Domain of unknown function (DUF4112)